MSRISHAGRTGGNRTGAEGTTSLCERRPQKLHSGASSKENLLPDLAQQTEVGRTVMGVTRNPKNIHAQRSGSVNLLDGVR